MTSAYVPIQGSIADIIKVAMLHMQCHDEVVLEVAPGALEATRELVVKTIDQAVETSAPLVAAPNAGDAIIVIDQRLMTRPW